MISSNIAHYELIDSGFGRKLENISGVLVNRPSPQAIWNPRLSDNEWKKVTSEVIRTKDGGGKWIHHRSIDEQNFSISAFSNLVFKLKFTSFGHCGVFFEQFSVWQLLHNEICELKNKLGRPPKVLNLFGYTGCASLVMAHAGAEVFHVDSSKGVLTWGQESQRLSKISSENIKWIHSDVQAFLKHSFKKNFFYDGVLADPPSWGHGAKKEVWNFEKDIYPFIQLVFSVLNKKNSFLFLSSHTHGVQSQALQNIIYDKRWKNISFGDLGVKHSMDSRILPAGVYAFGTSGR